MIYGMVCMCVGVHEQRVYCTTVVCIAVHICILRSTKYIYYDKYELFSYGTELKSCCCGGEIEQRAVMDKSRYTCVMVMDGVCKRKMAQFIVGLVNSSHSLARWLLRKGV